MVTVFMYPTLFLILHMSYLCLPKMWGKAESEKSPDKLRFPKGSTVYLKMTLVTHAQKASMVILVK